jgi:Uma2 family endonuclease
MVQTPLKPLRLEEFLTLPETKPASEFFDGQITQKPMPQGKHSTIQCDLGTTINGALKPGKIARAYPELRCTYPSGSRDSVYGGRSIVPDIAIFTWERIPRDTSGKVANTFSILVERGFANAPDWTIEILSPDPSQTKVVRNILHCLDHGTQMGWLIDPEEEMIFVYLANRTIAVVDEPTQRLPVPDFAAVLEVTIGQILSWLED